MAAEPPSVFAGVDAVGDVRRSTERVMSSASHVTIADDKVEEYASSLLSAAPAADITWATGGFHFDADAGKGGPLTCQYVFVLDALNFCFWPVEGLEYEHLARPLKLLLEADPHALDAERLAAVTEATLEEWFKPHTLPAAGERVRKLRELGSVLAAEFDGRAVEVVRRARHSAAALVGIVTAFFPGFRDHSVYRGEQVYLYKRAQILAGDVWAAYGKQTPPAAGGGAGGDRSAAGPESGAVADAADISPFAFHDMARLTMFADYRVPQVLRLCGVLRYNEALAATVDARRELPSGSEEEVEIRAATVVAVERLREALATRGRPMLAVEVDWLLWNLGEEKRDSLPPHHRTRTVFY